MTTSVVPPSLQRTNSNGQLNIYLLIQNKINGELLIISRDNLPPTLRTGKLFLNQQVTFRNGGRQNIEGTIVYMNHNQENCVIAKNDLLQKTKQNENGGNKPSDLSDVSDSRITITNVSSKKFMKKSLQIQKKTKNNKSKENSRTASSTSSLNDLDEAEDDDIADDSIEYTLPVTEPTSEVTTNETFSNANEIPSTVVETNENDFYLQEIDNLSRKLAEQAKIIKKKDDIIKQLRTTTIEIPRDEVVQNFFLSFADKIRQQTKEFKYRGNLQKDAASLGLPSQKLYEILKSKAVVTSIARDLFKTIVPEHDRQVDHWNDLKTHVLMKEKILIGMQNKFLQRYYGPLQADEKRIHTSLVGCLRNERYSQKKSHEQSSTTDKPDKDANNMEYTNQENVLDDLHYDD